MSQFAEGKPTPAFASLPPPPSTSAARAQSPSSHAAASTLAGLARNSPPSASSSNQSSTSKLPQSLYLNQSSANTTNGSPLKKEVGVDQQSQSTDIVGGYAPSASTSMNAKKQRENAANRRKKANRACSHCQKAHLTCDDARPCSRCVKKGQASTCTDGARKKAKYLLDDEELEELKRNKEAKKAAKLANQQGRKLPPGTPLQGPKMLAASAMQPSAVDYPAQGAMDAPTGANSAAAPAVASLLDQAASDSTPASSGHGPSPHPTSDFAATSNFDPTSSNQLPSGTAVPFDMNFDPSMHNFGSEATSLEYSILSSMLNESLLGGPGSGSPDQSPAIGVMDGWNITDAYHHSGEPGLNDFFGTGGGQANTEGLLPGLVGMDPVAGSYGQLGRLDQASGSGEAITENGYNTLDVSSPRDSRLVEVGTGVQASSDPQGVGSSAPFAIGSSSQRSTSNEPVTDINKAIASRRYARQQQDAVWRARIAKTYRDNTAPFPYPKGYHFLIKYVTEKFQKAEALRIVRALAIFRPSLIALQMPLTEEDEIFVERALQRTMLEFEKLISFSGTPTVVWRRTCEICVVGAEFCMLTQWPRDQLMGRRIYEVMDTDSTLEYWEKFALHAFENTSQSVMTTCTLVKPDGKLVPCAWSFTIKRDTFDLPSLIVGNFLPILS